jgi:hypothetical protein
MGEKELGLVAGFDHPTRRLGRGDSDDPREADDAEIDSMFDSLRGEGV